MTGNARTVTVDHVAGTPVRHPEMVALGRYFAIGPDGSTAYLAHRAKGVITPLDLASGAPGAPINAGPDPRAITITPDGATAYVIGSAGHGTLTPIDLTDRTAAPPIKVGPNPVAPAVAALIPANPART